MSARHHFATSERPPANVFGGPIAKVCRHCGTRRRAVEAYAYRRGTGTFVREWLYQLPGRSEWTTKETKCADVRAGKVNGR